MKITIEAKKNESLFEVSRRAKKNADANNCTVEVLYKGFSSLVYPNDIVENVIKFLKKNEIIARLAELNTVLAK